MTVIATIGAQPALPPIVVLDVDMQQRLAAMNEAARALKRRGLHVCEQIARPADHGRPILDLGDIGEHDAAYLAAQADCETRDLHHKTYRMALWGVRIVFTLQGIQA